MTRVTNFGRKRKYVEAGFASEPASTEQPTPESKTADRDQGDSAHSRKKRRKTRVQKTASGDNEQVPDGAKQAGAVDVEAKEKNAFIKQKRVKPEITKKRGGAKNIAISGYKKRTEQRRFKRISDRQAETVCFACREKGHAAKDCPKGVGEDGDVDGQKSMNTIVGICYRCGSTKHTLSHCKKPEDPLKRFPFASCFVCSGKGHLASACPHNKEKGIYPNGGSCKLCGQKTHLAKDCELRKKDASGTAATTVFGTGSSAGADEDDFHTFKRKNAEVSRDEKREDRRRRQLDIKAGLHTGTVKPFGKNPVPSKPRKVVFF